MIAGILLLISSLGAGLWAYDESMADGLNGWKRSHAPSAPAWTHSLAEYGYRRITDAGDVAKVLRALPAQLDSDGAVWASPDSRWFAVFTKAETGLPVLAYCLRCDEKARSWQPLGSGWDGFDLAQERGKRARAALPELKTKKKVEEPRDPREIRY